MNYLPCLPPQYPIFLPTKNLIIKKFPFKIFLPQPKNLFFYYSTIIHFSYSSFHFSSYYKVFHYQKIPFSIFPPHPSNLFGFFMLKNFSSSFYIFAPNAKKIFCFQFFPQFFKYFPSQGRKVKFFLLLDEQCSILLPFIGQSALYLSS